MTRTTFRSVELFGGAGGLALGAHAAGFNSEVFIEWDRWACDTVRENKKAGFESVQGWDVIQGDVRNVAWSAIEPGIDLVSGGPPCQPFSLGGKAKAADDARDMFPAASEAIRVLQPKAFLIENVKGLTRSTFSDYFRLIILRLKFPEVLSQPHEDWYTHLQRLEEIESQAALPELHYAVSYKVVNAADYGVPQHRHRVFIVGYRTDLGMSWKMPDKTHTYDALIRDQWVTGEYWEKHKVPMRMRPEKPKSLIPKILKIKSGDLIPSGKPWVTVRDALADLPEPALNGQDGWHNHVLQPGARTYVGHTGSPLDLPAKTLKAGAHGVPGGENMLRRVDGSVRYFSVRESARLQTFPDDYKLHGSWGEAMRQIGNAVPLKLAKVVAGSVADQLDSLRFSGSSEGPQVEPFVRSITA